MTFIERILRVTLIVFLGASCAAKLWSGHEPHFAVSRGVFVAATVLEIGMILGLLIKRLRAWASSGVALLAAIGICIELLARGKTCGCLGSVIRLSSAQHVLLNATVGALAVLVWYRVMESRSDLAASALKSSAHSE